MSYILSVDAGTTASKISLFGLNGRQEGIVTKEYQLLTPSALEVELAPETLWGAFTNGISELLLRTKVDPKEIKAIGISAQGETITAIDKEGNSLRNFIVWLDGRAEEEGAMLDREFDSDVCYRKTGQVKMVPTWPSAKILWMKNHEPKLFEKANKFLLVEDYLI